MFSCPHLIQSSAILQGFSCVFCWRHSAYSLKFVQIVSAPCVHVVKNVPFFLYEGCPPLGQIMDGLSIGLIE